MLLNIIFSHNRAMQLDYLLTSVLSSFKLDFKIVVIYHTTGQHKAGYDLLKSKYAAYPHISFAERRKVLFDWTFLPTFYAKDHRKFFLEKNFLNAKGDNFKQLLQREIKQSKCEFVMFNTDDGLFLDEVRIPLKVLDVLRTNPEQASYRLYVGANLTGFPRYVQKDIDYCQWDYYAEAKIHHWTYPFSVDGTVYHAKTMLKHLKKMAYDNPVTLEDRGFNYVRERKLFGMGFSPFSSQLLLTKLNRVTVDSDNATIHIKPDFLNEKFVAGYVLNLVIPKVIDNCNIVPLEVSLIKGKEKEVIYTLDKEGQEVQEKLEKVGEKIDFRDDTVR